MKITWSDPGCSKTWIGEIEGHQNVYVCVKKDVDSFFWMLVAARTDMCLYYTHSKRFQSPGDAANAAPEFAKSVFNIGGDS